MSQQLLNKLKLIGVFCHVVESGSMREAAAKLGISSPAVSQFISQLEADLGVTLLYRSTRRLGVSEAGERYYQWGKKMLQAAEQAEESIVQSKSTISGELRIALPVGLAARPIAQALFPIFEENQELKLSIIARDDEVDFIQQRLDLLIDCGVPNDSNYIYHLLGQNSVVICASPEYLTNSGSPVTPTELNQHTWLGLNLVESKGILSQVELSHNRQENFVLKPNLRFVFNDLNSLISHVKQGYGIAVLPALEVEEHIKNGELVVLLSDWKLAKHNVFALTADKNYPIKVKLALDAIKQYFLQKQLKNL